VSKERGSHVKKKNLNTLSSVGEKEAGGKTCSRHKLAGPGFIEKKKGRDLRMRKGEGPIEEKRRRFSVCYRPEEPSWKKAGRKERQKGRAN